MSNSLTRLHEKALTHAKRLRSVLDTHEETVGTIVNEAVRTGVTGAGAATAAALDHFLGPAGTPLPEAMVAGVPVVPVAALVLKGAAFVMTKSKSGASPHLHAFSNGLGAAALYGGTLRLLQSQAGQ